MLTDPRIPLWISKGRKNADSLASRGACALALLGVWNWRGTNAFGGKTVLPEMRKASVKQALDRLTGILQQKRARVSAVYLPIVGAQKIGVDDYLASDHTLADLEQLIKGPRPQPQAAAAEEPPLLPAIASLARIVTKSLSSRNPRCAPPWH
jgi:hypothetical protein